MFGKVISKDCENEKDPVGRIGDDNIGKYGMSVVTTVTHNPHNTQAAGGFILINEVRDRTSVIIMDMAVPTAATDGTGFQFRTEFCHKRIKNRF